MRKLLLVLFASLFSISVFAQNEFITTWKPSNVQSPISMNAPYPSSSTQAWMPVRGTNFSIYWEENGYPAHHFSMNNVTSAMYVLLDFGTPQNPDPGAATYTVKVSNGNGNFHQIMFKDPTLPGSVNNMGDNAKITGIIQWGNIQWSSMEYAFAACSNLNMTATDLPDLSAVTTLDAMFLGCVNLTANPSINNWNVSSVTKMISTFSSCHLFNQPLNNWDTSGVVHMEATFLLAKAFNQPLSNWDTSNVIDMTSLFNNAQSFNQPLDSWDVSSVTDCEFMFSNAWAFNQPLNSWDVSNVTLFNNMFSKALVFNSDISSWDTSSAVNMTGMFQYTTMFNQNIAGWNTSNVILMNAMFQNASAFNQNIGNWNTSQVTAMNNMFSGATAFNQNLGNWNLSSLLYAGSFFQNSGLNCQNYDSTLYGWSLNPATPSNISISSASPMIYTHPASVAARNYLINNKGWDILGDSYDDKCESALSTKENFSEINFGIYPNPASDYIYFKNLKDGVSYKVFDNSGRIVLQGKLNEDKIDVRTLTKGNYLLQIKTKNDVKNHKFLKQ